MCDNNCGFVEPICQANLRCEYYISCCDTDCLQGFLNCFYINCIVLRIIMFDIIDILPKSLCHLYFNPPPPPRPLFVSFNWFMLTVTIHCELRMILLVWIEINKIRIEFVLNCNIAIIMLWWHIVVPPPLSPPNTEISTLDILSRLSRIKFNDYSKL